MLYSCTHVAPLGVKGLTNIIDNKTDDDILTADVARPRYNTEYVHTNICTYIYTVSIKDCAMDRKLLSLNESQINYGTTTLNIFIY